MSFVKSLKCFFCSHEQSILEVSFPENLFDLITAYKISQLFWLCENCKKSYDQRPSLLSPLLLDKDKETKNVKLKGNNLSVKLPFTENIPDEQNNIKHAVLKDDNDLGRGDLSNDLNLSDPGNSKYGSKSPRYPQEILNIIKVDPVEDACNKKIVELVWNSLLYKLKENAEFSLLYNRPFYTGSAYNGMRIKDATEYDIDLVLKVPKTVQLTLKWKAIKDDRSNLAVVRFLTSNSTDGYLQPKSILSWFQSQCDLVKDELSLPHDVKNVKFLQSGPARTLIIETTLGYSINVDLVPVFEFEYSSLKDLPFYSEVMKTAEQNNNDRWLLVPKEMSQETNVPSSEVKLFWRLDLPNAEKKILSKKQCARPVVKILKSFRDKNDWKALASYYLKMVVLLAIIDNPKADYWDNGKLLDRLIDSLKQLKSHLEKKTLPHFLTGQNLLAKFNADQCNNWRNRLQSFITLIEEKPDSLKTFLESSESKAESNECFLNQDVLK